MPLGSESALGQGCHCFVSFLGAGLHLIHSPLNSLKSTTFMYPLSELSYWVSASYVVTPHGGPICVSSTAQFILRTQFFS